MDTTSYNIPAYELSRLAGPENKGSGYDTLATEEELAAVGRSGLLVACPMTERTQASGGCLACPHFRGVGRVATSGPTPPVEYRTRVMCAYPKQRRLTVSDQPMSGTYRKYLEDAVRAGGRWPGRNAGAETEVFVEQGVAVNCPISRAKQGSWRLELPPCPACEYFRGVEPGKKGPVCLCAHTGSITLLRPVVGSPELLEA